jgi:hypothetical protein
MVVLRQRCDGAAIVAVTSRRETAAAFKPIPAVVAPQDHEVNLLAKLLSNIRQPQIASSAVKAKAPRVPEPYAQISGSPSADPTNGLVSGTV